MDIETKEIVNQLKSRLEQFEDKDESYQEGIVRGMFFSITAMQQALHKYISLIREATAEPDIAKKIAKLNEADEAYKRYDKMCKHRDKAGDRFMKEVGG